MSDWTTGSRYESAHAAAGVAIAWLLTRVMSVAAASELASFITVRIDGTVLLATVGMSRMLT